MIHSTSNPASVYSFPSHECIRVYPDHIKELFPQVNIDTPGEIIYQPVKIGVSDDGKVYIEAHQDIYRKAGNLETVARDMIKKNLEDRVDWGKLRERAKA